MRVGIHQWSGTGCCENWLDCFTSFCLSASQPARLPAGLKLRMTMCLLCRDIEMHFRARVQSRTLLLKMNGETQRCLIAYDRAAKVLLFGSTHSEKFCHCLPVDLDTPAARHPAHGAAGSHGGPAESGKVGIHVNLGVDFRNILARLLPS
jgi:hypothetical protein